MPKVRVLKRFLEDARYGGDLRFAIDVGMGEGKFHCLGNLELGFGLFDTSEEAMNLEQHEKLSTHRFAAPPQTGCRPAVDRL